MKIYKRCNFTLHILATLEYTFYNRFYISDPLLSVIAEH